MADETGLPASFEAAWGLRERPGKGPRPGLSLDKIVTAAIELAAAEGIAAVSMGRVAKALGVSTMSLYRYVGSKDELLALMLDAGMGLPPTGFDPGRGWRAGLAAWAWAVLALYRGSPWSLQIPVTPPVTPNQIRWMEWGLSVQRGSALTGNEKMSAILLISGYVRNWATMTADIGPQSGRQPIPYGQILSRVIDPAEFPELSMIIAAGTLDDDDEDFDAEFVFGLDRILDGIEALVSARSAGAAGAPAGSPGPAPDPASPRPAAGRSGRGAG